MSEAVEVRVARLEEQLKFLVRDAEDAKASRGRQYESIEALRAAIDGVVSSMTSMANEVSVVKGKLDGQAPTIEEFITIKHKVVGAGKLGKWVWVTLGGLITFLFSSREAIIRWLTKQ